MSLPASYSPDLRSPSAQAEGLELSYLLNRGDAAAASRASSYGAIAAAGGRLLAEDVSAVNFSASNRNSSTVGGDNRAARDGGPMLFDRHPFSTIKSDFPSGDEDAGSLMNDYFNASATINTPFAEKVGREAGSRSSYRIDANLQSSLGGAQHQLQLSPPRGAKRLRGFRTHNQSSYEATSKTSERVSFDTAVQRAFIRLRTQASCSRRQVVAWRWWMVRATLRALRKLRTRRSDPSRFKMRSSQSTISFNSTGFSSNTSGQSQSLRLSFASPSGSHVVTGKKLLLKRDHAMNVSRVTGLSVRETITLPVASCIRILALFQTWVCTWLQRHRRRESRWDRPPSLSLYHHLMNISDDGVVRGAENWVRSRTISFLRTRVLTDCFLTWQSRTGLTTTAREFFAWSAKRRGYSALYSNLMHNKKEHLMSKPVQMSIKLHVLRARQAIRKWRDLITDRKHRRRVVSSMKSKMRSAMDVFIDNVDRRVARRNKVAFGNSMYELRKVASGIRRWRAFKSNRIPRQRSLRVAIRFALKRSIHRWHQLIVYRDTREAFTQLRLRKCWSAWNRVLKQRQAMRADQLSDLHATSTKFFKRTFWNHMKYAYKALSGEYKVLLTVRSRASFKRWHSWVHAFRAFNTRLGYLRKEFEKLPHFIRAAQMLMHPTLVKCFEALKRHMQEHFSEASEASAKDAWARCKLRMALVRMYERMKESAVARLTLSGKAILNEIKKEGKMHALGRIVRSDSKNLSYYSARLRAAQEQRDAARQAMLSDDVSRTVNDRRMYGVSRDIDGVAATITSVARARVASIFLQRWRRRLDVMRVYSSPSEVIEHYKHLHLVGAHNNMQPSRDRGRQGSSKLPLKKSRVGRFGDRINLTRLECLHRQSEMRYISSSSERHNEQSLKLKVESESDVLCCLFTCDRFSRGALALRYLSRHQLSRIATEQDKGLSTTLPAHLKRKLASYLRFFKERLRSAIEEKRYHNELIEYHIQQRSASAIKHMNRVSKTSEYSTRPANRLATSGTNASVFNEFTPMVHRYFLRLRRILLSKAPRRQDMSNRLQKRYSIEKRTFFRRLRIMMHDTAMTEKVLAKLLFFSLQKWKEAYVCKHHAKMTKRRILEELSRQRAANRAKFVIQRWLVYNMTAAFVRWRGHTSAWKRKTERIIARRYSNNMQHVFDSWRGLQLADIFYRNHRDVSCRRALIKKLAFMVRLHYRSVTFVDNHILRRNTRKAKAAIAFWRKATIRSLRRKNKADAYIHRRMLRLGWMAVLMNLKHRRDRKAMRITSTPTSSSTYLQGGSIQTPSKPRSDAHRAESMYLMSGGRRRTPSPPRSVGPAEGGPRGARGPIDRQHKHLQAYISKSPYLKHLYSEADIARLRVRPGRDANVDDDEQAVADKYMEHRAALAEALDRGATQLWGFRVLLHRCVITSYMRTMQVRMHCRFMLGRYLHFMHRMRSQRSLLSIAESFHVVMKLKKTLRLWLRRVRHKAKLKRLAGSAEDFFEHHRSSLAFLLWYSQSRV